MICPNCLSRHIVKNGNSNHKQRYLCRDCKETTYYPRKILPKKYSNTTEEQLINCQVTRKEFLTLDIELRRKILSRQVDNFVKDTKNESK